MMQQRLQTQLNKVASRYRDLYFLWMLAVIWLVATAVVVAVRTWTQTPLVVWSAVVGVECVLICLALGMASMLVRDYRWLARRIELAFPELRSCLLAAVEQQPELPNGKFRYLQSQVIDQALNHAKTHRWQDAVSNRILALAVAANIVPFGLFTLVSLAALFNALPTLASAASSSTDISAASSTFSVVVEPGDTEVEKGTSLLVLARVAGPMPAEAALVYQTESGEEIRLPMAASLNDPVFGARIPTVQQPLSYHVELGEQTTPSYRVRVFEYPQLERADAHLVYPAYTGMEERLVQDVRTVSVVEGTKLTLHCYLNKPVASAKLIETSKNHEAEPITLTASASGGRKSPGDASSIMYEAVIDCRQSRKLKLELIDEQGRQNVKPAQFSIHVLPNQPPNLKPVFPAKDLEVSALEELEAKATAWDDFGVKRVGLTYSLAEQEPVDVVLAEDAAARQKHELTNLIRLEELNAEPDQLLSYHWWVEDYGPDGQLRRTASDMYFAEVRPFEEIFRQGQQPPGGQQQQGQQGQGQNAQQAQELAKLQKDIINATWKLIRREIADKLTDAFATDAEQVHLSQTAAREQASALGERLQDEQSKEHLDAVLKHMDKAAEQLKAAHQTPASDPLKPALAAEQAVYQSLLKLRARENEVVRQQQRGQQRGSQSASRSQQQSQQLQQLDLRQEENRYETQRTAQEQQQESAQDRENRQVLNRLRELARRQHDLNERLKELQSALEEARTQQQKEEIRRQLQRLQDEQRQILQDTDELQARMEQPENLERMAQERQQLDETRDQVRRASEALEKEMVTQAAASGTRAERQFDDLREEFRRRASNRFSEELQQMRQAARELDEREREVSEKINESAQPQQRQPSLRDEGNNREQIAQQVSEQRQRLADLQEKMRETIQEAEDTEPLLTQRLYDTAREVQDKKLDKALEATERSVRQGLAEDAKQQEAAAGQGIRQLREGIDRAAEGVLGDETEALRRAREQLQNLSRELNQEIQRNTGQGQPQNGERRTEESQNAQPQAGPSQPGQQNGERRPGQPQEDQGQQPQQGRQGGQNQEGQPQQGEPQPGQAQAGERQQGQPQEGQQPGQRGQRSQRRLGGDQRTGGAGPFQDYVPGEFAPITGEGFREWSDRLRDVEEMVDDPDLRAETARIRERARMFRADLKRHSAEPQWDVLREQVAQPLVELEGRVAEELLRRTSKNALVPLDRDPVPPQYSEKTRRYYERLGSGTGGGP